MLIDSHDDFFHREIQTLGSCGNNAQIRLMRNQPIELFGTHICGIQYFLRHITERTDRIFEHSLSVHIHKRIADHLTTLN